MADWYAQSFFNRSNNGCQNRNGIIHTKESHRWSGLRLRARSIGPERGSWIFGWRTIGYLSGQIYRWYNAGGGRTKGYRLYTHTDLEEHLVHPQKTQEAIAKNELKKSLKINRSKTQILTISSAPTRIKSYLETEGSDEVHSGKELQMLGIYFNQKPTVAA